MGRAVPGDHLATPGSPVTVSIWKRWPTSSLERVNRTRIGVPTTLRVLAARAVKLSELPAQEATSIAEGFE